MQAQWVLPVRRVMAVRVLRARLPGRLLLTPEAAGAVSALPALLVRVVLAVAATVALMLTVRQGLLILAVAVAAAAATGHYARAVMAAPAS